MKKIQLYFLWVLIFGFFSCEDDSVGNSFERLPEERVDMSIEDFQQMLIGSEHGWATYFLFNGGNNDSYFNLRFLENRPDNPNGNNRVEIQYELDKEVHTEEVHYTLRYAQRIELIFDTYSHFARLVGAVDNGDFRFRLKSREEGRIIFDSFDDSETGAGILYLEKADNSENYKQVQKMRSFLLNDGHKSFYRLLQLDGSTQKYLYHYQVDAYLNWVENGELKTLNTGVEASSTGCRFTKPLMIENHQIDGLEFNAADSTFWVMENGKKIGILDYSDEKPFVYPGAVKMFMDAIGADTSTIMIAPLALSHKLNEAYTALQKKDPEFFMMVIEPCLHWIVFVNKNNAFKNAGYRIDTEYGEDSMAFKWVGSAKDDNGESYSAEYYKKHGKVLLDELVYEEGQPVKAFSIVPRGNYFYFVRDDDPTISFVGKPQFKEAF